MSSESKDPITEKEIDIEIAEIQEEQEMPVDTPDSQTAEETETKVEVLYSSCYRLYAHSITFLITLLSRSKLCP